VSGILHGIRRYLQDLGNLRIQRWFLNLFSRYS